MIVFASTFEEATWASADLNDRDFTFVDSTALPTITDVRTDFDLSISDKYRLLIEGTGITDTSTETVEVFVGEIKQTTTLVTSNLVEVEIDEKRNAYRDIARRGSILYFAIVDMSMIDPMY